MNYVCLSVTLKTSKQFDPNIERYWLGMYEKVDRTDVTIHMINYNKNIDRWIDVYTYKFTENKVVSLFREITEQKNWKNSLKS